jgi:hypothetical protein
MNFEDALYNCLLRRADLVAFDEVEESISNYWPKSTYFQTGFQTGLNNFNKNIVFTEKN